jgi:hypothetical protein
MAINYADIIATSARSVLTVVLGLIEIGMGLVRMEQGRLWMDQVVVLEGLRAIVRGVQSIRLEIAGEGGSWLDFGAHILRVLFLFIRIRGGIHVVFNWLIEQGGRL